METRPLPEIIKYLPIELLIKKAYDISVIMFGLTRTFFCLTKIFLILIKTLKQLALYNGKNNKSVLLVIKYPNNNDAVEAKEKFIKEYNPKLKTARY